MDSHNPWQAPGVPAQAGDTAGRPRRFRLGTLVPASHCPGCHAAVTFRASLMQPTPFWFRCRNCRRLYRVHAARFPLLFLTICGITTLLLLICIHVVRGYGAESLWLLLPLLSCVYLGLEYWTHRRLTRYGHFVQPVSETDTFEP